MSNNQDVYKVLIGRHPDGVAFEPMIKIWKKSCIHNYIYQVRIKVACGNVGT